MHLAFMESTKLPLFQQFLFFIKIYVCVLHEILDTLHVQVLMEARGFRIHWNWSYRQL